MATWIVKADRRQADYDQVLNRLRELEQSVQGLTVIAEPPEHFHGADDDGGFRDFAVMARLTHQRNEALEIVAEELLLEFGWLIDLAACE